MKLLPPVTSATEGQKLILAVPAPRLPRGPDSGQRAGSTVPVTSPRRKNPVGVGAVAVMVTVSPSDRNALDEPSAKVTGSVPLRVSSMNDPAVPGSGPEIVPDAYRSPGRTLAPPTVSCASIWAPV